LAREEIVLIALLGRERYGLEINKAVEEASRENRHLSFSSLYPTLHKLEKEGLVKSR
jgi:DNA-binding PadR family transcriptional regulator